MRITKRNLQGIQFTLCDHVHRFGSFIPALMFLQLPLSNKEYTKTIFFGNTISYYFYFHVFTSEYNVQYFLLFFKEHKKFKFSTVVL